MDKFKTKDILKAQLSETITVQRDTYNYLKNSYTQLSMILVYYEKIIIDILNKLLIDLSMILSNIRTLSAIRRIWKSIPQEYSFIKPNYERVFRDV